MILLSDALVLRHGRFLVLRPIFGFLTEAEAVLAHWPAGGRMVRPA
jgi:hypothetical protein